MKIKHILFDFDGVLVQGVDFAERAAQKYDLNEAAIRNVFMNHLAELLAGKVDMIELLPDHLKEIGWKGTAAGLYEAIYGGAHQFNQPLLQFIKEQLKGNVRCHIATNQDCHRYHMIAADTTVQDIFDIVYCSSELGVAKPDINYFAKIYILKSQTDPHLKRDEILFIDDSEENVIGAQQFGFRTFWYAHYDNDRADVLELLTQIQR